MCCCKLLCRASPAVLLIWLLGQLITVASKMVRLTPLRTLTLLALLSLFTANAVSANIILRVSACCESLSSMQHAAIHTSLAVQTSNYTFDPLEDMPADFGPRIPAQGVEGFLIVSVQALFLLCTCAIH